MKLKEKIILLLFFVISCSVNGQTIVNIYWDSIASSVESEYKQGVFFVPKTVEAQNDFLNNNIRQNSIRLNVIESALNNANNLNDCIIYLDNVANVIEQLANKTNKLIFIFEKMPAWLSSSNDGTPSSVPGWAVLNTKPPANWDEWDSVVYVITNRIVNTYGINNAYFEIWNEPDLGSWTGTKSEYFKLVKHTYDAIKSVSSTIPVGGPASNYWGNNIDFTPPYGYLSSQIADSSLIGQLIDSLYLWNKPFDFISWHNFSYTWQINYNAVDYITQKYTNLGMSIPEFIISEWNTQSSIRDTPIQKAFFIKNQFEMAKLPLAGNVIAAWQDFNQSTNEFHHDYGLLSYGSIHKPVYNALLLSDRISGNYIANSSNAPTDLITTVSNDTLKILITNYVPPAFVAALNSTLFDGHFNIYQLDSADYIDISTNDASKLDSIYKGMITIPNTNALNIAINNSIPVYNHYDSLQLNDRNFILNVNEISDTLIGVSIRIDSTNNNLQFKYDSLINQGYTQSDAISYITNYQDLEQTYVSLNNGQIAFGMQPNSLIFFQFIIPSLSSINDSFKKFNLQIFPNPTGGIVFIKSDKIIGKIIIIDINGKEIATFVINKKNYSIDLSNYPPGIYFIHFIDINKAIKLIRK